MADREHLFRALAAMSFLDRVLRVVPIANPAAGAEVVVTVPGGSVWRPISLVTTLATSAVVAVRGPSLIVDDGSTTVMRLPQGGTQAASLSVVNTWANGSGSPAGTSATGAQSVPLPDLVMPAGYRLRTLTNLIDVGDQYSAVALWVEELQSQPQGVHENIRDGREFQLIESSLAAEGNS